MYKYIPGGLPKGTPLVVVLHGCLEGGGHMEVNSKDSGNVEVEGGIKGYARNTGWIEYANKHDFAVLLPDQRPESELLSEALVEPGEGGMKKWIMVIIEDPKTRHRLTKNLEGMGKAGDTVSKGVVDQMHAWLEAPYKPFSKTL